LNWSQNCSLTPSNIYAAGITLRSS
jgi:hypothetical protein